MPPEFLSDRLGNRNHGRLDSDWIIEARAGSDRTVEDQIAAALSVLEVEIEEDGRVWTRGRTYSGRWLEQDEIDRLCERIDAANAGSPCEEC